MQCLEDARAALRQVSATVTHNPTPEWLNELERCKKAVTAAEEVLTQLDAEKKNGGTGTNTKSDTFR